MSFSNGNQIPMLYRLGSLLIDLTDRPMDISHCVTVSCVKERPGKRVHCPWRACMPICFLSMFLVNDCLNNTNLWRISAVPNMTSIRRDVSSFVVQRVFFFKSTVFSIFCLGLRSHGKFLQEFCHVRRRVWYSRCMIKLPTQNSEVLLHGPIDWLYVSQYDLHPSIPLFTPFPNCSLVWHFAITIRLATEVCPLRTCHPHWLMMWSCHCGFPPRRRTFRW